MVAGPIFFLFRSAILFILALLLFIYRFLYAMATYRRQSLYFVQCVDGSPPQNTRK